MTEIGMNTDTKELDLLDLWQIIKDGKRCILIITSTFVVLGLVYSFIATEYYRSTITLYPAGESGQSGMMLGNLQGLAETFGFGEISKSTYYIPDIVKSRQLKKDIISKIWKTNNFPQGISLIKFWELDDTSGFNMGKLLGKKVTVDSHLKHTESAIEKLDKLISVDEEDSGLITVSVLAEEPELAATIANYISEYIVEFIANRQNQHAWENRLFIEGRLEQSKSDLTIDEETLTEFRKNHPIALDTPELQQNRARLIRNIDLNQQVYITLRQQLEIAKIEELKKRVLIDILDEADPAVERAKPKRILIVLISFFVSLLSTIIFLIVKFEINNKN